MAEMIEIDGSEGEGGGQILRTSLSLSLITKKAFRIFNIRANRAKPGLMRQHVTAVEAAARVGQARVRGAAAGSRDLTFWPGETAAGEYRFSTGTAGSTTLVLQTILPPLLLARSGSMLTLEGGTHNTHAPPFDFVERAFVPVLKRMGPVVRVRLVRHGFYPVGGGKIEIDIEPAPQMAAISLLHRGAMRRTGARALVARVPYHVAQRELDVVARSLPVEASALRGESISDTAGPGNVLMIELEFDHVTEVVTAFGQRGVPAERVAEAAVEEARDYLAHDAPVGGHLADQLLLPMALGGGGEFRTGPLSLHARTNIQTIRRFLDTDIEVQAESGGTCAVRVGKTATDS